MCQDIVQGEWSGCRTGNGEKLSNSKLYVAWPSVPGCCLVSCCFLCDIHFIHYVDIGYCLSDATCKCPF